MNKTLPPIRETPKTKTKTWNKTVVTSKDGHNRQLPPLTQKSQNPVGSKKTSHGFHRMKSQRTLPPITQTSIDPDTLNELQKLLRPSMTRSDSTHGSSAPSSPNNEVKFCKNFHRALKENNYVKQAIALQQLGDLHRQRAKDAVISDDIFSSDGTEDVLKASAAYVGALARTAHLEQRQSLLIRIKDLEATYIEMYKNSEYCKETHLSVEHHIQLQTTYVNNPMERYMKKLDKFREFVRKRLNRIQDMWKHKFVEQERVSTKDHDVEVLKEALNLGNKVKLEMKGLFKDIVTDCVGKLGEPPCKYAIVGVGDIATNYITPYSDFQYFILTKSPELDTKEYFKYLATLINIQIMLLGETPLTATILKLVQDPYNKMIRTIMDDCSPNGVKVDISLSSTSINPFLFKYSKHILECDQDVDLMKTPGDMARFIYMLHDKGLHNFVLKMYQNMLVTGDNELYNEYRDMVEESFIPKHLKQDGRIKTDNENLLSHIMDVFQVDYIVDLHRNQVNMTLSKICKDISLIASLIYILKVLFCLSNKLPVMIIEELRQKGFITEEGESDLKTLLCVGYYLHIRLHSEKSGQNATRDLLSYNAEQCSHIDITHSMFAAKNDGIFVRFYGILIPLLNTLAKFVTTEEQRYLLKTQLHQKEAIFKYHAYSRLAKYREAVEAAKTFVQEKTVELPVMEEFQLYTDLGLVALKCNETKDANMFFTRAMEVKDAILDDDTGKIFAFVTTWHNMGLVYLFEEKFTKAMTYFEESIQLGTEMGGNKIFKTPRGRYFIAMVYSSIARTKIEMWSLQEAVKYLYRSLDSVQKLNSSKQQVLHWKRNITYDLAQAKILLGHSKDALSLNKLVIEYDISLTNIHCPQIQFAAILSLMTQTMKTMGKAVLVDLYGLYSQKMALFVVGENAHNAEEEVFEQIDVHDVLGILRICRNVTKNTEKKKCAKFSTLVCALHNEEAFFRKTTNLELAWDKLSHASVLYDLELYKDAKEATSSSLNLISNIFGQNSYNLLRALALKYGGLCLLHTGLAEEALKQFQLCYTTFGMSLLKAKMPEQLKILEYIAEAYRRLRIYDEATKSWEDCISQRKNLFGPVHLVVAYSYRKQGLLLHEMMEYDGAVASLQSSLDMYKRIHGHGKRHHDVAQLYFDLGKVFCDIFEQEKAEHSLVKSLETRRALNKSTANQKELVDILTYLGNFYRLESRLEEAIRLHKESVTVASELFPKDTKEMAKIQACLAEDYQADEQYEESAATFELAIEAHRADVGIANDNLDIANWLRELGRAYEVLGIRDKAQQCHKRSLQIKEQFMGKEAADADLLDSLSRMAERHENKGDYKRAIPLRKQYILKQRKIEGSERAIITALKALSNDYLQTGEHEFAQVYNTELLEMLRQMHGTEVAHYEIADAVHNAGFVFETMGRVPKAIKLYEEALTMYQELDETGDYKDMIGIAMTNLGNSMNTAGQQEAVGILQGSVDILTALSLPTEKKHILGRAVYCLGIAYEVYPHYEKALTNHKLALSIREEISSQLDADMTVAESLRALGRSYCHLKQYDKGIPLLVQSITIVKTVREKESNYVFIADAHAHVELGQAYTDSGNPQAGISTYLHALDIMYKVYGKTKPHLQVAKCLGLLAEAAKESSETDKAIEFAFQSMKSYQTVLKHVHDHPIYAHLTALIADVYMIDKSYKRALEYYRKAAQLYLSLHQGNVLALDVERNMSKIRESEKLMKLSEDCEIMD